MSDYECKVRALYMLLWASRRSKQISYSIHLLRNTLRESCDEIVESLLDKGHITPSPPSGFYLTDEGVRTWARLATECATVNNFDPALKIWADWIMDVPDLLQSLNQEFKQLDRHIDYPVVKKAKDMRWVEVEGNVQRLKQYRITPAGTAHLSSLQPKQSLAS